MTTNNHISTLAFYAAQHAIAWLSEPSEIIQSLMGLWPQIDSETQRSILDEVRQAPSALFSQEAVSDWQSFLNWATLPPITIKLAMDGDSWCALCGENLQSGVSGWGDSPGLAIHDLLNQGGFHKLVGRVEDAE
jgi:hypothetical protein